MISVFGSVGARSGGKLGAVSDLVEMQGGVARLKAPINQALLQAFSTRSAIGPLSSLYVTSGGAGPAADPGADAWVWEASASASSALSALDQIKTAQGRALVQLDTLQAALEGGQAPIRYIITKDAATAAWYASSGGAALIDTAAVAGTSEATKGMSTAGKIAVGALILGGGLLAVRAISRPSAVPVY